VPRNRTRDLLGDVTSKLFANDPEDYEIAPPSGPRLYAKIRAGDIACPQCGAVHSFGVTRRGHTGGYNSRTQMFVCQGRAGERRCGFRAFLGVVVWPIRRGTPISAEDIRPNVREALQLRTNYFREDPPPRLPDDGSGRRPYRVNQMCLCGGRCPVHDP
jgi:hypothetical protein